jgi:hypothetical protein
MADTPTIEAPRWFKLAYDAAVTGVITNNSHLDLFNYGVPLMDELLAVQTPQEAANLVKDAGRAMVQEADLMAEAVGVPSDNFQNIPAQTSQALHKLDRAYAIWQSKNGRAAVRNSARAYDVRMGASQLLGSLAEPCNSFEGLAEDVRAAYTVRAAIDLAGFYRRIVENIINPAAAGMGRPAGELGFNTNIANGKLERAENRLGEAAKFGWPSWLVKDAKQQDLYQALRGSLDYEKNYLLSLKNPGAAYTKFVQAALADQSAGRIEAAALNFLQAGASGRFVEGVEGTEVLTNYRKGMEMLNTLPDSETKRGWLANVRDHSVDLRTRYPSLTGKVDELVVMLAPPASGIQGVA